MSVSATASTVDNAFLGAYHWRLDSAVDARGQRIDALFVREDKPVELNFSDGRLSVVNTCNRMGGGYTLNQGRLEIGRMASTMMACVDPKLGALDREVGMRLDGALTITRQAGVPPAIVLTTASGDALKFVGAPTTQARFGGEGETVFLEVAPETGPCSHPMMPNAQCLQVREIRYDSRGIKVGESAQWENFYQTIEGYTHQPGIRQVLRTKRYQVKNPPAGASSVAYVLDMVVETELLRPDR